MRADFTLSLNLEDNKRREGEKEKEKRRKREGESSSLRCRRETKGLRDKREGGKLQSRTEKYHLPA